MIPVVARVRCFCGKPVRFSKREQGTCQNCGAFFAVTRDGEKFRMIWAYGEGKRLLDRPEIVSFKKQ